MSSSLARPFVVSLGALLFACGSDPLRQPDDDRGGRGGSGGTSGSGSGATGGVPVLPDYTQSPCYGAPEQTLVYDFATHATRDINATCRAEGERTRVYVADELWEVPFAPDAAPITQGEIDAFMYGYELKGHAGSVDPTLGVLPNDELVFGALSPASLTDGKLPIFVIDSGGAGEGYLCSWCDRTELHLDAPMLRSLHTEKAFSIAAHETFHAIHRGYDANETIWVDETLAEAAMTANGYFTDQTWLGAFLQDTNIDWGPGQDDIASFNYGAGLLYGTYLLERGGSGLMRAITSEPRDSWAGIDAALASVGDPASAWQIYLEMGLAVFLDDPSSYGFQSFELGANALLPYVVATGQSYSDTLQPYGLAYVVLDADARGLTLETSADVSARLVLPGSPAQVLEVAPGVAVDFAATPRVLMLTARARAPFTLTVR